VRVNLPPGLTSLLGKLVSKEGAAAENPKEGLAQKGLDSVQTHKGAPLIDERVLAGLGFNAKDNSAEHNLAEKANIERFLQDPKEAKEAIKKDAFEARSSEAKPGEKTGNKSDVASEPERMETHDTRERAKEETRKEEKSADVRAFAEETREKREARETPDARDAQDQRRRDRDQDEQEKHGQGWVQPELEREEDARPKRGLREADALGAVHRCKGHLEDGSRCLRKPLEGAQYCREHLHGALPPVGRL
jgi:hypothetical protein